MSALVPVTSARTSQLLLVMARRFSGARIQLSEIGRSLGNRSFGLLLLVFALPNAQPIGFPGLSTITGIPLALIALQMVLGREQPYLPAWLGRRSLPGREFSQLVEKTTPWLARIERLLKPRLGWMTGKRGERVLGAFCLTLAAILMLPLPLGNLLPGISIVMLALGLMEKDGALILVGLTVGLAGIALASGVIWGAAEAAMLALR